RGAGRLAGRCNAQPRPKPGGDDPHQTPREGQEETMRRKPLPPTCIVWGRGAAASQIVREGEATERAAIVARAYGWESDDPEAWAVEVHATTADVDAATRADGAVWGWLPL